MERILKKVDNRFVWFESPIVVKTHWSDTDFKVIEKVIAKNYEKPKQKDHQNPCIRQTEKIFSLQYEAEKGEYIVSKEVIHEPTTLKHYSFVMDTDLNVYAKLVDDYDNEVLLQIN